MIPHSISEFMYKVYRFINDKQQSRFSALKQRRNVTNSKLAAIHIALIAFGLLICTPEGVFASTVIDVTEYPYLASPNNTQDDDSVAINAAIGSAQRGDVVFLPQGTYHITTFIDMAPGVTLAGEGQAETVLKYIGQEDLLTMVWVCADNVELSHFSIDANGAGNSAHKIQSGVWSSGESGCNAVNLRIEDVKITGMYRNGILCQGAEDPLIRGNEITALLNPKKDERIGIELLSCHGAVVENNTVDEWISVDGVSHCAVRNNTIIGNASHSYLYGLELVDSRFCVFAGNKVLNGAMIGLSIATCNPNRLVPVSYNYYADNEISDARGMGAQINSDTLYPANEQEWAAPCEYWTTGQVYSQYFYKNLFRNTKDVEIGEGVGFLFNSKFQEAGDPGGAIEHITLEENYIQNNAGHGLQLFGNIIRLSFLDNKIQNNGGKSLDLLELPDENNDGYADVDYFCPYDPLAYPCYVTWETQPGYVAGNQVDIELVSQGADDNAQPQARFVSQFSSEKVIQFNNQSTDPDGDSLTLLWDFGEGAPCAHLAGGPTHLQCENPTHEYSSTGSYTVTLIAWDDKGLGARTTMQVDVP